MEPEDRQDLDRARRGHDDAFRALVERHSRYLYAVAHRVTGNGSDAEDVATTCSPSSGCRSSRNHSPTR